PANTRCANGCTKRRSRPGRLRGTSNVSAVKIWRRIDGSADARANKALATWLALPRPSGSASTRFLPTRAMMASATGSGSSNRSGLPSLRFMSGRWDECFGRLQTASAEHTRCYRAFGEPPSPLWGGVGGGGGGNSGRTHLDQEQLLPSPPLPYKGGGSRPSLSVDL